MSYIVPREKPEKCVNCCPFVDRITYDCMMMYGNDYSDLKSQYEHCPLVDIPTPHGRLKDVDKIEYEKLYIDDVGKSYEMVGKDDIDELPTVIEAEGAT